MALEQQRSREHERERPPVRRVAERPVPERTEAMPGGDYAARTHDRVGNQAILAQVRDPANTDGELRRGLGLMQLAKVEGAAPQKVDPETGSTTSGADPIKAKHDAEDTKVLGVITDLLGEYQSVSVKAGVNTEPDEDKDPKIKQTDVDLKVPYRINGAGNREYGVGQGTYPSSRLPKGDTDAEKKALAAAKLGKATPTEYQTAVQDVADKNAVNLQSQKGWTDKDGNLTALGRRAIEEQLRASLKYTDKQGTQSQTMGIDCSGFVYEAIRRVQRQNNYSDRIWNDTTGRTNVGTATMLGDTKNFKPVTEARDYRSGDLVLQKGHVEMVMGQNDMNRDEAVRYGLPNEAVQPWTPPEPKAKKGKKAPKGPKPTPINPEVRLVHVAESQPGRANFDKRTGDRYGPDVDQYIVVRRGDGQVQWYQQTGANPKDPSQRVWKPVNRQVRRVNLGFPADPKPADDDE